MPRPRKPTTGEIEAAARKYEVTTRTIYRWIEDGVDIDDLEAVADHLLRQHAPSPVALESITSKLHE